VQVGDVDILSIHDGAAYLERKLVYEAMPDEAWEPHRQFLTDDGARIELALGGFLIRTGEHLVLVDAGVANAGGAMFQGGRLLESLAECGVGVTDITDVVFTHLHFDHVGWATRKGEVVFTNATYRCDARDWVHFVGPDPGATRKPSPLTDRMSFWDHDGPLLPGIDVLPAAGHTPGSTVVVISSGRERAMLLGDVVHCPVELLDDEWSGMGDVDPELAKRTRNSLARELEGTDIPVAAAHFPGLQFGRLLTGEGKRHWVVP
jgi:glyoxylase-like metal-dependent hydrolase (beta-lactamase superfamily II)